jgi:hypothetical protein
LTDGKAGIQINDIVKLNEEMDTETSDINVEHENDYQSQSGSHEYQIISNENMKESSNPFMLTGRRILDLNYFLNRLKIIEQHGKKFGCNINNLNIIGEMQDGLNSRLQFVCHMCNAVFHIWTNEPVDENNETPVNINTLAVESIMSIGGGLYNLNEIVSNMEIPPMGGKTYKRHHDIVSDVWIKAATEKMLEACKREAEYATQEGEVDEFGIPCIDVVADGCWSKRSYRTNYNALSGAAAIIGKRFGEILYIAVKNKYCMICNVAEKRNETPKTHQCFKNFSGSSTSMESNIIVEGFKNSVELCGLKFTKLIADGDSSTYNKIVNSQPYDNIKVEKIECRNHMLRNLCNKLKLLSTETRYPLYFRKALAGKILKLRRCITSAVKHRKNLNIEFKDKIALLKKDVDNSIFHTFGNHKNCSSYFCNKQNESNENSTISEMEKCKEFFDKLQSIISRVSQHARSLIYDVDSNIVEQFHSIVAKFVGGKRINYSKGRSYESRCFGAVLSFNSKSQMHYITHKTICGKSPSKFKKELELRRREKVRKCLQYRRENRQNKKKTQAANSMNDPDYGINCQKEDMEPDEYARQKQLFLHKMTKTADEIKAFERNTVLQSESKLWIDERRKLLTASNFKRVCSRRKTTSCAKLVKNLVYPQEINSKAVKHGKCNYIR